MSLSKAGEASRESDDDALLEKLTPEEIAQLEIDLDELDPKNAALPAGLRQKDQTTKVPTGPFRRDSLLQFLEKEALETEENEDLVPFTREKRGTPYIPKVQAAKLVPRDVASRMAEPGAELPAEEVEGGVNLEPELEEALANASEAEICDLAAILGMHTLMSNKQYYKALSSNAIVNKEGLNSVVHPDECKVFPEEPPNPTDVEQSLQRIRKNDQNLTQVNLNNIADISMSTLIEIAEVLKSNGHVEKFSLVGTCCNDSVALALADMLKVNGVLKSLNIESNCLTAPGVLAIVEALKENDCLTELKLDNQRQQLGNRVEMEMAAMVEGNKSLLRFGYQFSSPGPRSRVTNAITRNNDLVRKKRLEKFTKA
uniref:Tropomodulin 4 (muscle) n=1 Tax=Eptatretus burgeri TaxID=7764 RepID=A0A8C4X0T2_EPTBU